MCKNIFLKWDIYIFYIFIYIFLCKKSFFFIKLFFHIKTFFSANNVYFVKNKDIFSKKNFCFTLILQQMHNHSIYLSRSLKLKKKPMRRFYLLWFLCNLLNLKVNNSSNNQIKRYIFLSHSCYLILHFIYFIQCFIISYCRNVVHVLLKTGSKKNN